MTPVPASEIVDLEREAELEDLARRILDGDRDAETQLVERFHRGIGYLLRRLVGDRALAEDLTQETFRVALEALRRGAVDRTSRVDAYLRGVARNLARNETRKTRRRGPEEPIRADAPASDRLADRLTDRTPSPLARAVAIEDRRAVRRVLDELGSERDRQILRRHYLEEEPRQAVCEDLGIEPSTYYVVLHRARRRFRVLLERSVAPTPTAEAR